MGFLSQADATVRVSIFLADVVVSPLLYLGGAIVYVDLAARVGLFRDERSAAPGRSEPLRVGSLAGTREEEIDVPTYLDALLRHREVTQTLNANPPGCAR